MNDDHEPQSELQISLLLPKISADVGPVICKTFREPGTTPLLLFVAGGQGAGTGAFIRALLGLKDVAAVPPYIQKLLQEVWEPTLGEERKAAKVKELETQLALLARKAGGQRHFVLQSGPETAFTIPYGTPYNGLRRPDLAGLIQLAEPHFDVRMLFVARDPTEMVARWIAQGEWSEEACRNQVQIPVQRTDLFTSWPLGPCGFVLFQGRVVEDSLVYLAAQAKMLSRDYFRVAWMKGRETDGLAMGEEVASFLGLPDGVEFSQLLARFLEEDEGDESSHQGGLSATSRGTLERTFSGLREMLWSSLKQPGLSVWSNREMGYLEECPKTTREKERDR